MCFWKLCLLSTQELWKWKLPSTKKRHIQMHAQICPGLPYCATIFIFRDNEKETYCCLEDRTRALHILSPTFIGTEQVFPPEHKTDGRNQRFTSYLVLPSSSKPKHNLLKIKAKGSGFFLETPVPSWMISVPTNLFQYLQRQELWASPVLCRFLPHGVCHTEVQVSSLWSLAQQAEELLLPTQN